jgi:hypothetical protein
MHPFRWIHPKLVFYLDDRYKVFKNLVENANYNAIIELRNNLNIRKLFTEIFCILCQAKKMHSIELIKINTSEAFIPNNINERRKATSMDYLELFFRPDDPKSLFFPINEFSYSISCDSQDLT